MVEFENAKSDFELIDMLRLRYQVFAEDILSLNGILLGYRLAKPSDYVTNLDGFKTYLSEVNKVSPRSITWTEQISDEAKHREYEIPVFLTHLDQYRGIEYVDHGKVELTWEQRDFDFRRRLKIVNVDYPEIPLKPPHMLKAVGIPGVRTHAFFFDENGFKYYEQCLGDMERLKKWAADCFNISSEEWLER